ncbi:transcription factor COE1 [Sarcoptes scabiei]|nr:transcription factor COE1 [Sarcoptes scabiei]
MDTKFLKLVKIHENADLIDDCVRLLNEEWPRNSEIREKTLRKSSEKIVPMCLALIDSDRNVFGFVKLTSEKPFNPIIFIESLIVAKEHRSKGLGRFIMDQIEMIACSNQFEKIHLTTTDKEEFYRRLGYERLHNSSIDRSFDKILMFKNLSKK